MTTLTHAFFIAKPPTRSPEPKPSASPSPEKPAARMPAQNELFDDIPIDDVYYVDDGCAACMLGRVMLLTLAIFVAGVAWAIWG